MIYTCSYTSLDSPGGVPRWCRDFHECFPTVPLDEKDLKAFVGVGGDGPDLKAYVGHWCWSDFIEATGVDVAVPDYEKAVLLARWLMQTGRVTAEDIIVGDHYWSVCYPPDRTVQIRHGVWSHTTAADVAKGIPPDFPDQHRAGIAFQKAFSEAGGRSVAVSDFIAGSIKTQWDWEMPVINAGIDLDVFRPSSKKLPRHRPVICHFINDRSNPVKGAATIDLLERELDADVLLLDELPTFFDGISKFEGLSQCDLAVHPSAHEGNSYAVLETLASGVPLVSYDVGLMWKARKEEAPVGVVLDRDLRSPQFFLEGVRQALRAPGSFRPREWVEQFSIERFRQEWRDFMQREFGKLQWVGVRVASSN